MIATPSVTGLDERLARWALAGINNETISREDATAVLADPSIPLLPLVHTAGLVRRHHCGDSVQVHVLNNVQNGACPEDCGYCGQAKTAETPIRAYKLKPREEIIAEAQRAKDAGAFRYCMVLSGTGPDDADIEHMSACIREVKERFGLETCLSSGILDEAKARKLKEAGLDRLNHNLNTSREHYSEVCTTHTYQDRVDTLGAARGAGLQLCTGLIVGMGETHGDLVDVAMELRAVRAESIPVNLLIPIPGAQITEPACNGAALTPEFCLRALCMMRLANPDAEVRVAAGREHHLRSMQALALEPASSLFVDGYLLTKGAAPIETLRLIRDAGFTLDLDGSPPPPLVREAWDNLAPDDTGAQIDGTPTELSVFKSDKLSAKKVEKMAGKRG
jgi:biotin synthase